MNLPLWAGVFGLVVSIVFIVRALREMKKNTPGHSRNAAMIHLAMGGLFVPVCLFIILTSA